MPFRRSPKRIDFEKILDFIQKWFFIPLVGVLFLLLLVWSIDPIRDLLKAHGFRDLDTEKIAAMTIAALLFVLVSFNQRMKQLGDRIDAFSPSADSKIISGGIKDVYAELDKIIAELGSGIGGGRTLDVLGLTLFSAWPILLEPNLGSAVGSLQGWEINVYFLHHDYLDANPLFANTWTLHADAELSAIRDFAANKAQLLKDNGTTLKVSQYKFFPAIHGFRTGAGHLLISYIHWTGDRADMPVQFYEIFTPSDRSPRAAYYHGLFDNWIERAKRDAVAGHVITIPALALPAPAAAAAPPPPPPAPAAAAPAAPPPTTPPTTH